MTSSRVSRCVAMTLLLWGCDPEELPPEGQVLLYVETDAIVPLEPGAQDPTGQPALFDRLRIELYPPSATEPCEECFREFGVDRAMFRDRRVSIGVVPPVGTTGYRVRVQLYRSGGSDVVAPRPSSTLKSVVELPPVEEEGVVEAHVVLLTADLGTPRGTLDAPTPTAPGPPPLSLVDSFARDYRRGCAALPADDELCVPGGAYWMGDPDFDVPSELLVVVSPFFMTSTEVTVESFRDSGLAHLSNVYPHGTGGTEPCTFTFEPGPFDAYPLNCQTREVSVEYCARRGGTLPTEAQFEYVARARRSADNPWGNEPPGCEDAVFGRSTDASAPPPLRACLGLGAGAQPPGTGLLDRLPLEGGEVLDLAGNLTEWMQDEWQRGHEPCWTPALLFDPMCSEPSVEQPGHLSVRGANWTDPGIVLLGAVRSTIEGGQDKASVRIGFRCVRPG